MASKASKLDQYKLHTSFYRDTVIHTTYQSDQEEGQRRVGVKATWKREQELGAGAFGVVRREREKGSGRLRAVKIIPRQNFKNRREVEALVELQDHPNLFVLFFGWFEDAHNIYLAMEYIQHGDLAQYIGQYGAKAKTEVKQITSQVLEGLVVLHEKEFCHRDLKPQNILIASTSQIWVKISDFGISKREEGTSLITFCGTTCYQAPEQLGLWPRKGSSYTRAVDLWALGVIVHVILTSEVPFFDISQNVFSLDSESSSMPRSPGMYPTCNMGPVIDCQLLSDYCRGIANFPSDSLRKNRVCGEGIGFVKSLLAADPNARVSAADALKSPWLIRTNFETLETLRSQFRSLGVQIGLEDANRLIAEKDRAIIIDTLHSRTMDDIWGMQCKAVSRGYLEVVKILLKVIDDIDFKLKGLSLLQVAAGGGHLAAMELLVDKGANVNAGPALVQGRTALQAAASGGHLDAVKLLLDKGADINAEPAENQGRTALQAAVEFGHLDVIQLLLDRGANVNAKPASQQGRTALQAAAEGGHLDAMKLLLGRGANVDAKAGYADRAALHAAAKSGHLDAVKLLLDKGADVNANFYGQTALQAAAESGNLDIIQLLLAKGAHDTAKPTWWQGLTALQEAAKGGYLDAMKLVLDRGAGVNSRNSQRALQTAVEREHLGAMELLRGWGVEQR